MTRHLKKTRNRENQCQVYNFSLKIYETITEKIIYPKKIQNILCSPHPPPHPPKKKKYVDSKASSSTFTILPVQNSKLGISY